MTADNTVNIDSRDLRRAFGSFATGVTIVTTLDSDGQPCGYTANSFSTVSLEPPLVQVSIAKTSYGCQVFTKSGCYAVNVLARNQRELSNQFASQGVDKFLNVRWSSGNTGAPILEDVVAWFDCAEFKQVDAGDHIILIGEVVNYSYNTDAPLGFCRGAYVSFGLSPKMLQMIASPGTLCVGAVVEADGKVLLERDPTSGLVSLPTASEIGAADKPGSLLSKLHSAGIDVDLPFIYSAYHQHDTRYVIYLGDLLSVRDADETERLQFYSGEEVPWESITDPAITSLLQRYLKEQALGNFAVYIGDHDHGEIYQG